MALLTSTSNPSTLNVLARIAAAELASADDQQILGKKALPESDGHAPIRSAFSSAGGNLSVHQDQSCDLESPIVYLEQLFARHGIRLSGRRCTSAAMLKNKALIPRPSAQDVEAYSYETAKAVRTGDLPQLKELYFQQGFSLNACNRFGESLLHMCCRRGHAEMVEFMTTEAKVNPRVIDDMGRTAFHDVCWSSQPNLDTMDVLLKVLPPIGLMMQDARGHTPLQYAPRKQWGVWLQYLQEREDVFVDWIRTKKERAAMARRHLQQQEQARLAAIPRIVEMNPSA